MNQVLAKISRKQKLVKVLSDKTIYENISFNNDLFIDYNPDHNLDEECWFKIEKFSEKEFCLKFLKDKFDSKDFESMEKSKFNKIKYIVTIQENNFYFQKITSSLFLKKKLISFNEHIKLEEGDHLILNKLPDSIYFKLEDVLIFRNISVISSIFKGIDMLYKEATDQEVQDFLSKDFIKTIGFCKDKVSKPNRKRIALAMDTLNKLDDEEQKSIINYINGYCSEKLIFKEDTQQFEISNDEQLKNLLYGIGQRFYTTPIGDEKRLANSIIKLG